MNSTDALKELGKALRRAAEAFEDALRIIYEHLLKHFETAQTKQADAGRDLPKLRKERPLIKHQFIGLTAEAAPFWAA